MKMRYVYNFLYIFQQMLRDSSDSEEQQERGKEFLNRNESSGAFEVIGDLPQTTSVLHVSTISQNIILNECLKPKILSLNDWKTLLTVNNSSHSIVNYVSIVHAICKGLQPNVKIIFWETLCEKSSILPTLKQSNSHNQKYNKTIKECIDKLKERVSDIFPAEQLKQSLEMTSELLYNYYAEDPEVGFCKSMEYLAFGLVVALRENSNVEAELLMNSGHYFSCIMRKRKLRDMYFPGFPGLFTKIKQLQDEVKTQIPDVYQKINTLQKQWQHLFFKHYLTVFLHKIPYKSAFTKIIQLLLFQSSYLITYVLKRILQETRQQLIAMKKEDLEEHIKNDLFCSYIARYKEGQLPECLNSLLIKVEDIGK